MDRDTSLITPFIDTAAAEVASNGADGALSDSEHSAFTAALRLPAGAGPLEILAAIAVVRERAAAGELLERIALLSLVRIRQLLGLLETASPLDCAAELAARVPADMARAAIVTMQLAQARDTLRHLEVTEIMRDALRV